MATQEARLKAMLDLIGADIADLTATKASVIVLESTDPDPSPIVDGILYLRKVT